MFPVIKETFTKSLVVYHILCKYKPPVTNELIIK